MMGLWLRWIQQGVTLGSLALASWARSQEAAFETIEPLLDYLRQYFGDEEASE